MYVVCHHCYCLLSVACCMLLLMLMSSHVATDAISHHMSLAILIDKKTGETLQAARARVLALNNRTGTPSHTRS
jgi:hypothetical protein